MAIFQIISVTLISIFPRKSEALTVASMTVLYFALGFSDVVVDSLMVITARKLPENGQSYLLSYMRTVQSVGGFAGAIIAAHQTNITKEEVCFIIYAALGVLVLIAAILFETRFEDTNFTKGSSEENGNPSA